MTKAPVLVSDARSGVHHSNLQEILDASTSAGQALMQGQNQYQTPAWLAKDLGQLLPRSHYGSVLDPQGAAGALVTTINASSRYVSEIDNRFKGTVDADLKAGISRITTNCVRLDDLMTEFFQSEIRFDCIVANPPFGLKWKTKGDPVDSTAWTWGFILRRLAQYGSGYIISNIEALRRYKITEHPFAYLVQEFPAGGVWDGVGINVGVVHFVANKSHGMKRIEHVWNETPRPGDMLRKFDNEIRLSNAGSYVRGHEENWTLLAKLVREENSNRPDFNIYLDNQGVLKTYLSTRSSLKLQHSEIQRLSRINDCHPLTLTTEKETRDLLNEFIADGVYTIDPLALAAIKSALDQVRSLALPISPVTDFELVAYADEEEVLVARRGVKSPKGIKLVGGKGYSVKTGSYTFKERFTRKKLHYSYKNGDTTLEDHDCELSGQDRFLEVVDENMKSHRFMDRPPEGTDWQHPEALLWDLFERPKVLTVAEAMKDRYELNRNKLLTHAMFAGFTYFDGQLDYYARMACKDYGLVGADVGTGKTLGALSLIAIRSPRRTLIVAPQGTMRSSGDEGEQDYQASQWVQEIRRFAPGEPVFQLFNLEDYRAIIHANPTPKNELPPGIYITYPQAYWQNHAFECLPTTWKDVEEVKFCKKMGLPFDEERAVEDCYSLGVGSSNPAGIRCIANPSLATIVATEQGEWGMIIIDEAHLMCNLDAQVTQNLIRQQPKLRYAMTATPIPNFVFNLFSLLGWLCVPGWYKGGIRNAAWPYSVDELHRFKTTFMSTEVDMTEQDKARAAGKKDWKNKGVRSSPVISAPARLLKLLKPSMAYISKEACNPNLQPCEIKDVRVPLGKEQQMLYAYWLDRGNYVREFDSPLTIALVQLTRLRGTCAAPATVDYNSIKDPETGKIIRRVCTSNFNPKTIAILELIRECLQRGEQAVTVSARVDQSDAIAQCLVDAGIPISRIDSTVPAHLHTAEANRFKRGDARVMLMGIKCAQGHSFDQCPNLIIGSLEWSYGSLHQAKGRVWRLTSRKPVKVWCVLHQNTIEELLFDRVALKQDAATICLQGKRVPRDFMPLDSSEVLGEHVVNYDKGDGEIQSEAECESQWPALKRALVLSYNPNAVAA